MFVRLIILISFFEIGFGTLPTPSINELIGIFSGQAKLSPQCSNTQILESKIYYKLYNQESKHTPIYINKENLTSIDTSLKVRFIVHGWLGSSSRMWVTHMKDAYLNAKPATVILIDWSHYADNIMYTSAVCAVPQVGRLLGNFIFKLGEQTGIALEDVVITGFSLGAHVAGFAGQEIQTLSGGRKIGQINGLDTAGLGFFDKPTSARLDKSDALFVQGIHTNDGLSGYGKPYATVDFIVSCAAFICGTFQPGCPLYVGEPFTGLPEALSTLFCSHLRSVIYFIESIESKEFLGYPQTGCVGSRTSNVGAIMGEHCPNTTIGVQYLTVNSFPPHAKGTAGTCSIF